MALLRTVKASTLMETLVASVLTVVLFMVSSLILNNLFGNNIKHQTDAIENRLYELEYLTLRHKLSLPYYEDFKSWSITITPQTDNYQNLIDFEAVNTNTNTTIQNQIYDTR